jgi:hypothetical protein
MDWIYLFGLSLVLWGGCGGVMAVARRLWTLDTALRVHLVAAPVMAFSLSALHGWLAPGFSSLLRAALMTGLAVTLDALVVAPMFEGSYAMFRSVIGTWLPFAAIFVASLAAGILLPG